MWWSRRPGKARPTISTTSSPSDVPPVAVFATPDDIYASTLHARLFRKKDQLWVEDLGSTNGTYVNSEKITQAQRLGRGDMLQAGSTVFEVTR